MVSSLESRSLTYVLIVALLLSTHNCVGVVESNSTVLHILALGPFPDPGTDPGPGWDAAPALIPAARLAVEMINNRTDILAGYQLKLLEGDSGCRLTHQAFVNFTVNTFYGGDRTVVGIVGPGCSEATLALAPLTVRNELNILQMSIATTPLISGTQPEHNNTFRTVTSSLKYIDAFEEIIITEQKWNRVAALYDNLREFHIATFNAFRERIGSQRLFYSSGIEEQLLSGALDDLKRNRLRVVFVFAGRGLARNVLCSAYHRNLLFPSYQWFFTDRIFDDFVIDLEDSQGNIICTAEQMSIALNGAILSINQFKRQNQHTKNTAAQLSYKEYERLYYESLEEYLQEINLNTSQFAATAFNYFNAYFDATWALALSLNNSIQELNTKGYNLSYHYHYNRPTTKEVGDVVRSKLKELEFEGMGGTIVFDEIRHEVASIDIDLYQIRYDENRSEAVEYKAGVFGPLIISNDTILIDDEFETIIEEIPFQLGVFFIVLFALIAVAVLALHISNIYYRNNHFVKASSPRLTHLIFSGLYLLLAYSLVFIAQDSFVRSFVDKPVLYGVSCNTIAWCFTLTFSLVFGVLCGRTWRIYRIFTHIKRTRIRFISDNDVILFVTFLIFVDMFILCAWSLEDPLQLTPVKTQSLDTKVVIMYGCFGKNVPLWTGAIAVFKLVLMFIAVYLSILTRTVRRKEYKNTLNINILTYSLVFLVALVFLFGFLRALTNLFVLSFVFLNILNILIVISVSATLILPPLWPIFRENLCTLFQNSGLLSRARALRSNLSSFRPQTAPSRSHTEVTNHSSINRRKVTIKF